METGGPFAFGEFPDDEEVGGTELPLRGWLPPEDRLWRHPSELQHDACADDAARESGRPVRPFNRWAAVTAGVVGAAALSGVALTLARSGTPPLPSTITTASVTSLATPAPSVAAGARNAPTVASAPSLLQLVAALRASLVEIVAHGASGSTTHLTGIVLPVGDLVMTSAAGLGSPESVEVTSSDGRSHRASLAGTDVRAGVAVIKIDGSLVPATFADDVLHPQQLAVTVCLCARQSSTSVPPGPAVAIGMVREVGTAATADGGPSLVDAIEAEMPLGSAPWGSVLLDDAGKVVGLLDGVRDEEGDTFGYFVPAPLAVDVAEELASLHRVTRGWIGVVCSDAPGGGAMVTSVLPDSPAAAAGLTPGDVVEAVGPHPVGSLADLQARLYAVAPGTELPLTLVHSGQVHSAVVTVGALPS